MAVPTTFSSNSRRVFREEKSFHLDDDKGRPHEPVLNHPPRHRRRVWVSSAMQVVSLEEEELTAQRDAAVLIFKELQKKLQLQAEEYERRTEAHEMARIEAEIELQQLQREENGSAMTTRGQVRMVTQGWIIGIVLGWAAGFLLGCVFSPVLGFMLVLPFVSAGVMGGLIYAQLRDKMRALRRRTAVPEASQDKEEFLRQLQGRSDVSLTTPTTDMDISMPSGSFLRRVAMTAAEVVMRSALDVTIASVSSILSGSGGGAG